MPSDTVQQRNALGMFMGVFIPCNLSIFGVILFERLGWVVGQAGVYLAYLILALGYTMVTITTLSLSAIATNGKVKGNSLDNSCPRSKIDAFD